MEDVQQDVRVGDTRHGRGVFAERGFMHGEVVGHVTGMVIQDPDYESDYCVDLDQGDALEPDPPFRYLNHSCEPNCKIVFREPNGDHDSEPAVWVEAIGSIPAGRQLTIDYAWPADMTMPCGCQSPNCRGWIVDADQLHLVRRKPPACAGVGRVTSSH